MQLQYAVLQYAQLHTKNYAKKIKYTRLYINITYSIIYNVLEKTAELSN